MPVGTRREGAEAWAPILGTTAHCHLTWQAPGHSWPKLSLSKDRWARPVGYLASVQPPHRTH